MRGGEVARLRRKGVSFAHGRCGGFATAFVASSETDQGEIDAPRSLYASNTAICPVGSSRHRMGELKSDKESQAPSPGAATLGKLRIIIKWATRANHLPSERFPLRSMRIGGATCLPPGPPLGDIRKYGRWGATAVNIYLYFDDVVFRGMGKFFAPGHGVLNQLQMLQGKGVTARTLPRYVNMQKNVDSAHGEAFAEPSYMCGGRYSDKAVTGTHDYTPSPHSASSSSSKQQVKTEIREEGNINTVRRKSNKEAKGKSEEQK